MKLGKVAIFGVALFFLLWTEETQAGLTFLSPADMQKIAVRQSQNKLRAGNVNRRGVEPAGEEIGVTIPLDMSMKLTQEQFQKQRAAVQDFLYSFLSLGSSQDTEDKNGNGQ
ncbi:ghrelin-like [Mantella aurantiaca]